MSISSIIFTSNLLQTFHERASSHMQEQPRNKLSQHRRKNGHTTFTAYVVAIIAILAATFIFFRYSNTVEIDDEEKIVKVQQFVVPDTTVTLSGNQGLDALKTITLDTRSSGRDFDPSTNIGFSATSPIPESSGSPSSPLVEETASGLSGLDYNSSLIGRNYEEAITEIELFYNYLDQQSYITSIPQRVTSNEYFSELIQKILDNPPLVSGETDDLFNILKNTAHFFRIVGRENILLLKSIYSQEKNVVEDILSDFYTVTKAPKYLKSHFSIDLEEGSLYEYASFFLTTMGGRLYLFRQDSRLRTLVSYYSVLLVEEANYSGYNAHGIDISPALDNLIIDIENSGTLFHYKDIYLDNLYRIKEKRL